MQPKSKLEDQWKLEQTRWWIGKYPNKSFCDYSRYVFLKDGLILGADFNHCKKRTRVSVFFIDHNSASDVWIRRPLACEFDLAEVITDVRWNATIRDATLPAMTDEIAPKRSVSDMKSNKVEQILLCIAATSHKTYCVLIEGQRVVRELLLHLDCAQTRAFPSKRIVCPARIDGISYAPDDNHFAREERAWAVCSETGSVAVLDSTLNLLEHWHGPKRTHLSHFFIDNLGVPTSLVRTDAGPRYELKWEILKYRSPGPEQFVERFESKLVGFMGACAKTPDTTFVYLENRLSCVRWTSSGSDYALLCEGSTSNLSWPILCASENWVFGKRNGIVQSVKDPMVRFDFDPSNSDNASGPIEFWASDPDTVWVIHDKNLSRLRFRLGTPDRLSQTATLALAKSVLNSIPDEESRKWFAAAIVNLQSTNHTIKSIKHIQ